MKCMKWLLLFILIISFPFGWTMDIRNNPRVIILKGKNIETAQAKLRKFQDELQERDVMIKVRQTFFPEI